MSGSKNVSRRGVNLPCAVSPTPFGVELPPMPLPRGVRLGPYEILDAIGAGGMGEVYRARDERLERDVAIKVLPPGLLTDESARKRFRKEALALAKLNHPNIAVIHDVGEQGGMDYLVMECVPGHSLAEEAKSRPVSEKEAVALGVQIATALEEAHEQSIVHRDLKPGNIMVTPKRQIKVLDFGLAKILSDVSDLSGMETFSEPQNMAGTLPYMAPEQLSGEPADARTDIHAFGAVMFEMLTGRRVYQEEYGPQLTDVILHQRPVAPRALNPRVSPEMERIILKCLEKDRENRYQSAKELGVDLRRLSAPSAATAMTAGSPRPRIQIVAVLSIAVVLVIALATGLLYWRNRGGESVDSLAVLPFANMSGNPDADYLSDGLTESLIDSLSQLPNLKVMSRSAVSRYKGKDIDAQTAGRELGVRDVVSGTMIRRGDDLSVSVELVKVSDDSALWGAQYDRKLVGALAVQDDIAHQIAERLRVRPSNEQMAQMEKDQTTNPEAYQLYLKGRYYAGQFTQEGLDKGFDYFHQAIALDPNYALAYSGLSYHYSLLGDLFMDPAEAMPRAKEAALKAVELDDTLAEAHADLGWVYVLYDYDWAAAERELKRALVLNPNSAPAHEFYAWYLISVARTAEGIAEGRRAVALDPLSAETTSFLGVNFYYSHHYDEAVAELRESLDLDPGYWFGYYYLGQTYAKQGRFPEALAAEEKARAVMDFPVVQAELARDYALSGHPVEARGSLDELLARAKRQYVPAYAIGTVYAALGDKSAAVVQLRQGYARHSYFLDNLKLDPGVDNLRSDSRFQDLLRAMNYPQQ
jgi:eukaryotic-like serine/threonine-protein kinase